MTGALAIFAKTPCLSPVKTRLAADIGVEKAERFYRHSVICLEELAFDVMRETENDLAAYWAVGEENGLDHPLWKNLDRLWTGNGSLGERLYHVYATLFEKHDHVILIGTDSPQLSSERILEAHTHLKKKAGHIIGPADDGGYYLYGGHTSLPRELWLSVPYSVSKTCKVFASELAAYGDIRFLQQDFDVDTKVDIKKLHNSVMTRHAQIALMNWLEGAEI